MSDFLGPDTALATGFVDLDGDGHLETTDVTTGPGTVLTDSNPYGGTWGRSWSGSSGDDVVEGRSS